MSKNIKYNDTFALIIKVKEKTNFTEKDDYLLVEQSQQTRRYIAYNFRTFEEARIKRQLLFDDTFCDFVAQARFDNDNDYEYYRKLKNELFTRYGYSKEKLFKIY